MMDGTALVEIGIPRELAEGNGCAPAGFLKVSFIDAVEGSRFPPAVGS
jgi:hypothetical protein